MTMPMTDDQSKPRRQRVDRAVKLAAENRWEEAVTANQSLLEQFGEDVSAYNRLGKACLELGRYAEARRAYSRSLELDPQNTIARKNLDRLANVDVDEEAQAPHIRAGSGANVFVEETGKTAVVQLLRPASADVLGKLTAGDRVELRAEGRALMVYDTDGDRLGQIEPKLGLRLINFMEGGNRYEAAIVAIDGNHVRVIIRETFQHPSQFGKVSFPPRDGAESGFRSYIKGSVIHYEVDDEEDIYDEGDYGNETDADNEEALDEHEPAEDDDRASE
jgi:tetratricopeptide (TPR) repeat protein